MPVEAFGALRHVPRAAPYRKFLVASYAVNTKRAYAGDVAHFRSWGGRIPSTPNQICRYLAEHAGKLAFATLSRRIAAIHREHAGRGLRSPARTEVVRATLRGIGRTYSRRQRRVKPLLPQLLRKMLPGMRGALGARDAALLLLGFFGGFRRSELTALNLTDLTVRSRGISVLIRKSKTDQEGLGRTVSIPRLRSALCPVSAVQRWLKLRNASEGPLFTSLTPKQHVTDKRLSGTSVASVVKRLVRQIGLDPANFSGHSLRAGFVTSAARAGAAIWQIKEQTGHRSDAVVGSYIRAGGRAGLEAARLVGGCR
jgi:integrase